eukprot:1157619-Pelagomonas_calceolata.AAC.32
MDIPTSASPVGDVRHRQQSNWSSEVVMDEDTDVCVGWQALIGPVMDNKQSHADEAAQSVEHSQSSICLATHWGSPRGPRTADLRTKPLRWGPPTHAHSPLIPECTEAYQQASDITSLCRAHECTQGCRQLAILLP